jgi:hypothetical protein
MLRKCHQTLVQSVLNLNERISDRDRRASLEWKVLIYDDRTLAILSTLLKVSGLIEVGVTFHESIARKRDPIPNVAAVYLVEPTESNLTRIAEDCAAHLYDRVHVNFVSSISSPSLEQFAAMVAERSDGSSIQDVFDQYLDFSSTDPGLFTLRESDSYLLDIYGGRAQEDQAASACQAIGESLVSVFLTAGEIPRILYKRGSLVGQMVAGAFSGKINPLAADLEFMGKTPR